MPTNRLADPITSPKDPAFTMDRDGSMRIRDAASSMVQHIDNILYSTNGFVGVKHHIVSPYTARSSVIVNGAYHRSLLQGNVPINSGAMPLYEHVGGVLCYTDISLYVDDELCACRDSMDASLNIRTGQYGMLTTAYTSRYIVGIRFNRLASLSNPQQWSIVFAVTSIQRRHEGGGTPSPGGGQHTVIIGDDNNTINNKANFHHRPGEQRPSSQDDSLWFTDRRGADLSVGGGPPACSEAIRVRLLVEVRADVHAWASYVDPFADSPCGGDSDEGGVLKDGYMSVSTSSGVGVRTDVSSVMSAGVFPLVVDRSPPSVSSPSGVGVGYAESSSSVHSSFDGLQYPNYRTASISKTASMSARGEGLEMKLVSDVLLSTAFNVAVGPEGFSEGADPITFERTYGHNVTAPTAPSQVSSYLTLPPTAPMALLPYRDLAFQQKEVLDSFWSEHDVSVTLHGDAHMYRATNALQYNSYVLYCSARGAGEHRGISRGGLSFGGNQVQVNLQTYLYHGIYYSLTDPRMAFNLIRHLYGMLPEARNAARGMAIPRGALYPHKTVTGANCSAFSLSSCARFQVNADLAHVIMLYLTVVGSTIPLNEEMMCMELLLETARMWLCVGMWHDAETLFRIDDVNGPDEYSGLTENNFYTHVSAMKHMSGAVRTFKAFEKSHTLAAAALLQHVDMGRDEIAELQRAADAIVLHRDDRTGVYFAHAQFDELVEWRVDEPPRHPLSQNYYPAVIFRHKVVQIAEVLLAMLVHPESFERADLKRNLAYYEPLCTHDHPLSYSVLSCAKFSAFGDFGNGSDEFLMLAQLNLDNNKVASDGLHLSWMSGTWFSLAFGIGGVKILEGALHFRPCLPVGWEQCVFTLKWRGSTLKVTIRADAITYELIKGNVCRFSHFDARVRLDNLSEARRKVTIPRIVYQDAGSFDGMIFTLESFFSNTDDLNFQSWATVLQRYLEDCTRRNLLMGNPSTHKTYPLTQGEYLASGLCMQDGGHGSLDGLQQVLASRGLVLPIGSPQDSEMVESLYGLMNAKMEEVRALLQDFDLIPIPQMMDLLEDLSRSGIRVAIATFTTSTRDVLAKCPKSLADFTTTMIDGEEASEKGLKGRPTTQLFVHAANKMHLEPSRCVVVGSGFGDTYDSGELSQFFRIVDLALGECHMESSDANVRVMSGRDIPVTTARFEDWLLS